MKPRLIALLYIGIALAAGSPGATADAFVFCLGAPAASAGPGATVEVQLAALNRSPAETAFVVPPTLAGRVTGASGRWDVIVRAGGTAGSSRAVPPGGFALWALSFELPPDATGRLVLELGQPVPLQLVLPAPVARSHPAALSASLAPASVIERQTAVSQLKNYFAGSFAPHEPLYFVYGGNAPAAKFQISFKYRLPLDQDWLASRLPQMRGLHLAYTQRTLWDIRGQSSPFYDTSYMPELLYQFAVPASEQTGLITWLGWQGGLQHESNGKNGIDSRSLNVAYARTAVVFGDLNGWHLTAVPRAFTYVGDLSNNPNIADYRGWGDLRLVVGRNDGPALSLYGRVGRGFRHGALQADLTVPTTMLSGSFATYLQLQYWTGYGESLLAYDRKSDTVRAGLSLVR